jgi:four helix bundle protein
MHEPETTKPTTRPTTSPTTEPEDPGVPHTGWRPGPFDHERLDAFAVAREALRRGDRVARGLPRGYAPLADQLRRALLSAYLGVAEAASRSGADRRMRFRCARGEAAEAAAALDAAALLDLAPRDAVAPVIALLARLAAMLTRLARLSE